MKIEKQRQKISVFGIDMKIGGMEKSLVEFVNRLSSKFSVFLFLENKNGELLEQINNDVTIHELKVCRHKNKILRKLINLLRKLCFWCRYHNKFFCSISYATYSRNCAVLALISSKNNIMYVHSDYYNYFAGDEEKIINFFSYIELDRFDKVLFVSNEARNNIINLEHYKYLNAYVVNNFIDYEKILQLSQVKIKDFNVKSSNNNFLYVGRLDNSSKNFDLLINSFKERVNKDMYSKLFIIGDGVDKEYLSRIVKQKKIEKYVVFLGEKKNPYPYIRKCDCLLLSSKYEGFPVIYLEALVLNKQFISTINTSDNFINIKDYFSCVEPRNFAQALIDFTKEHKKNNVDFEKIMNSNFDYLCEIINKEED